MIASKQLETKKSGSLINKTMLKHIIILVSQWERYFLAACRKFEDKIGFWCYLWFIRFPYLLFKIFNFFLQIKILRFVNLWRIHTLKNKIDEFNEFFLIKKALFLKVDIKKNNFFSQILSSALLILMNLLKLKSFDYQKSYGVSILFSSFNDIKKMRRDNENLAESIRQLRETLDTEI